MHRQFRVATKIQMGLKWGEEEDNYLIRLLVCLQNKQMEKISAGSDTSLLEKHISKYSNILR
jgi:hypothetical protein